MSLTQREKRLIAAAAVLLVLIIIFNIFGRPAISRVKTLRRVVSDKRKVLSELRAKSEEYKNLSGKLEQIRLEMSHQSEERKILSFVERVQKDYGLMQKVVYMKPSAMTVNDIYERNTIEIKMQNITLDQLVQFLLKVESSELKIGIRTLEIKRGNKDSDLLDTIIQLVNISSIRSD